MPSASEQGLRGRPQGLGRQGAGLRHPRSPEPATRRPASPVSAVPARRAGITGVRSRETPSSGGQGGALWGGLRGWAVRAGPRFAPVRAPEVAPHSCPSDPAGSSTRTRCRHPAPTPMLGQRGHQVAPPPQGLPPLGPSIPRDPFSPPRTSSLRAGPSGSPPNCGAFPGHQQPGCLGAPSASPPTPAGSPSPPVRGIYALHCSFPPRLVSARTCHL